MANTTFEDIKLALNNPLLSPNILRTSIQTSPLISSGAAVIDAQLSAALSGKAYNAISRFTFMTHPEPNVSNDDSTAIAVPHSLSSGKQITYPAFLNIPIGWMNIIQQAYGIDADGMVRGYFGKYWQTELDRFALKNVIGVLGTSIGTANLTYDDSTHVFDLENHLYAVNKLGDQAGKVAVIVAHSALVTRMKILNGTNNIANYQGDLPKGLFSFNGYLVVEDDTIPYDPITKVATVLYLAQGAIRLGAYIPNALRIAENQLAGNGAGMQSIVSDYHLMTAVPGFSFTGVDNLVDGSVTKSVLANSANYTWVYEDDIRQAPLCALKCKVKE